MIKPILVVVTLAALAGCDDGAKSPSKEQPVAAATVTPAEKVVAAKQLQLPDGSVLPLNGELLKQMNKPSDKGKSIINVVSFDASSHKAEGEISSELEKLGYSRRVVEEREGFLKVHYYKAKSPVIGGIYTDQDKESNGQEKTLTRLYWQES
ncbi:hypothetical protein [Pseudomonas sp. 30_B]|uniref:hypothetical protein n=1 Tax=Pseudomonas sp. 30_B TaxID=2813575 RepID=UPI001A9E753C|nr:hypothetical protein [Pseudomonas sp. 30_B]